MEVMGRLDSVEKELQSEITEHKEDIRQLNARIDSLTLENQQTLITEGKNRHFYGTSPQLFRFNTNICPLKTPAFHSHKVIV